MLCSVQREDNYGDSTQNYTLKTLKYLAIDARQIFLCWFLDSRTFEEVSIETGVQF